MLRPDYRFGLSDRRGNVISLDLFNFELCNRLSNIHIRIRGKLDKINLLNFVKDVTTFPYIE